MSTRITHALDVLRRLNEARRIGQRLAEQELDGELDYIDELAGYQRRASTHFGEPVPVDDVRGPQRNPNWRAALDKLSAMRGRAT